MDGPVMIITDLLGRTVPLHIKDDHYGPAWKDRLGFIYGPVMIITDLLGRTVAD